MSTDTVGYSARRADSSPRLALTVPEAAKAIGVSPRQIYNLARDYGLPTIKIGGRRLVRCADLDKWVAEQLVANPTEAPTAGAEGVRREQD